MSNTFQVQRGGESLVARLVDNGERRIELTYRTPKGDSQVGVFKNGLGVSTMATMADGSYPTQDFEGNTFLPGYKIAYYKLGPELRKQIPSDWHAVLGRVLAPKEE